MLLQILIKYTDDFQFITFTLERQNVFRALCYKLFLKFLQLQFEYPKMTNFGIFTTNIQNLLRFFSLQVV